MIDPEISNLIDSKISAYSSNAMFSVAKIPAHGHTGIDSQKILASDIDGVLGTAYAKLYANSGTTVSVAATPVKLNLKGLDVASGVTADATNSKLTIVTAGYYQINCMIEFGNILADNYYMLMIYKNSNELCRGRSHASISVNTMVVISDIVNLAVGDELEVYAFQQSGQNASVTQGIGTSRFSIFKI